jgi:hypothetical protein
MMTYMTYNFFFALMTLLPVLIWFAVSLWVALDADKMPDEAWALAGESKNVWTAISILLMWPFGLIFYFFIVRKKVAALARTINEDVLIDKAAARLRKESHDDRASHVSTPEFEAVKTSHGEKVDPSSEEDSNVSYQNAALAETLRNHTSDSRKTDENDGVFNYEESDARDDFSESEQTIPPKPDYPPTVGERHDEDADKTAAYPVVPPKPTHAPRVGNDGASE